MDFGCYVGCVVKVDVVSGLFFHGKVLDADDKFLKIIDKFGKNVIVSYSDIVHIREVGNGN